MIITKYSYNEESTWNFQQLNLQDLNLIVGKTSSGKTRIINTLINFSKLFKQDKGELRAGNWEIGFKLNKDDVIEYNYKLSINRQQNITSEKLEKNGTTLLEFDGNTLVIENDRIEGLSPQMMALKTFSRKMNFEEIISNFQDIFLRRHNPGVGKEGNELTSLKKLSLLKDEETFLKAIRKSDTISPETGFYFLKKFDKKNFDELKKAFSTCFPCATDIDLLPIEEVPSIRVDDIIDKEKLYCVCIKEQGQWIPRFEVSSGMHRFIEALVDIYTPPHNSIIIYDEFENGLDPFVIGALVDIYLEKLFEHQYIFTSHHPYIIDKIPPKNWIIVRRKGYVVENFPGSNVEQDEDSLSGNFISLLNSIEYRGA